jgi:catechol 2,3-dioxygenase-like lactoylglutathione lyase family enzyme
MKLDNIRLLVDDVPAAAVFYRVLLGEEPSYSSDLYVQFEAGIGLFGRKLMNDVSGKMAKPATPLPEIQDVAVAVLDASAEGLDAAHDRLIAAGVCFENPPADRPEWGLRTAHLRDPAGHLIELFEPLT